MSSHKHHEHLERIKNTIHTSNVSEKTKSDSVKHIEEWVAEDRAEGVLMEELVEKFAELKPLFAEVGLI